MPRRTIAKSLTPQQATVLRTIYQLFDQQGSWPRYRDLERAVRFPLVSVIKDLRDTFVGFHTPIGSTTICWLTLRGLSTQPAAKTDVAHVLAIVRLVAAEALSRGPATRVTG